MEFATMALRNLLPKLTQLLHAEYKLQKSARNGIEDLCKELDAIDAFLCKISKVPRDQLDEQHKIWAREVRDLSYDMEDIVNKFMVDVEGPETPSKSAFEKFFNKMKDKVNKAKTRREIVQEIEDIKQRVKDVAERRDRYNLDAITPARITPVDPRIVSLYTEASKLVGIDEAKKEVIMKLTKGDDDQHQERIISIAGFGGLGKTTLAKAVFDEIQGQFDCTAFVSVSRNPDVKNLLKGILYKLRNGREPGEYLDDPTQLIDLVRESLQNRRYLIVIDDIWNIEPWEIIGCALNIENSMGSRIITTTRIIDVAEQVGGCYRLKPLTDENSEKLFYERIFGKDKCPEQFSEVSKRILKKCGGVPLAIITTSSLLAKKSEKKYIEYWNYVCDSIGSGLESNNYLNSMRKILLLSYDDLPFYLKTCLLYLSTFPEDDEIEKGELVRKWVAEGFVCKREDQSFLKCGEYYFNELINRSLIQPVGMDVVEGTTWGCRVHDMVLDLIISLSKEECFILGDRKHYSPESEKVRWLFLHCDTTGWPTMNLRKLRSLSIFYSDCVVTNPVPSLSCHVLRVLDLRGGNFIEDIAILGFIGSLSHLRYLRLRLVNRNYARDPIPEEIGKLRFLQTLDLSGIALGELPSSFTRLTQLIWIRLYGFTRLPNGSLKNLTTSLEVLEYVIVTPEFFTEELVNLTRLRVLKVEVKLPEDRQSWQACGEAMAASLGKLHKIESLKISNESWLSDFCMDGSVEPPLGNLRLLSLGAVKTLPTWINSASLPVLSYLALTVQQHRREDIQILGTLPCLRHLKFDVYAEKALERSEVGPGAFPCAISCNFQGQRTVPAMVPSVFLEGSMPRLEDYKFTVLVRDFCGSGAAYTIDDLALAHILPSLRSVSAAVLSYGYSEEVQRSIEEKLKREAAAHPNHPRLKIENWC